MTEAFIEILVRFLNSGMKDFEAFEMFLLKNSLTLSDLIFYLWVNFQAHISNQKNISATSLKSLGFITEL